MRIRGNIKANIKSAALVERALLIESRQGVRNGLSCLGAARQAFLVHDPATNN
jgi:hypothetical protein